MKKSIIYSIAVLAVLALSASQVSAFDGVKSKRSGKFIAPELRKEFKENFKNLSQEEKNKLKGERKEIREERRVEMESFLRLSREQIKEMRKNGDKMSDILAKQGVTEEEARDFLTDRSNERIDRIVEKHDLTSEQESDLRGRINKMVGKILEKWFK